MDEHDVVAERFEAHRARLRAVAYQTLGSASEADDAVQEAWLRLSRTDPGSIENLGGWLTTVVARVCLNMLQSRREQPVGMHLPEPVVTDADGIDPEQEALLADSIGPALLVILHTLAPAERLAFVLHDMFAVPFDDIAAIVGRSPAAARQLASRAAGGSRAWIRSPAPIWPGSGQSPAPSSPPPATATSARCWRSSTQTSWCAPTAPRRSAVRRRWPDARSRSLESPRSPCPH